MAILFVLPFYAVLAVAMGIEDPIFRNPVPVWQPWYWNPGNFLDTFNKIFGSTARTIGGVTIITALGLALYCLTLLLRNREPFWRRAEGDAVARPTRVSIAAVLLVVLGIIAIVTGIATIPSYAPVGATLSLVLGATVIVAAPGVWLLKELWRRIGIGLAIAASFLYTLVLFSLLSAGGDAIFGPAFLRTFIYVAAASAGCILVGYPVAYYVARYGGKRKGLFLMLLVAPFWISYMMRMLAWVNILQPDGYLNRLLTFTQVLPHPYGWLEGHGFTVVLGLIYGYVPYMILPLFAGLDRIDSSLLEAARDLGASRPRTFLRVTLPLSKQAILAGSVIVTLPMFGDYYTNNLLSRRPTTQMIGNLVDNTIGAPGRGAQAAVLVLMLSLILIVPMLYYLRETAKETDNP